MKRFAQGLQGLFTSGPQAADDSASRRQVQNLLDDLEDPPPNGLLLNLATGFPSALLCVLAAGVLAGALAGREVGGAVQPAVGVPVAVAPLAGGLGAAGSAGVVGDGGAVGAEKRPEAAQASSAAPVGRHAQLQALELQALLGTVKTELP